MKNYWLMKTEPSVFSWDDLVKEGISIWDGVRNYEARNNLRKMRTGDRALIYHSVNNPGIVGIAEIVREYYPDPTAKSGNWTVVEIKPVEKLKRFLPLQELRKIDGLRNMTLFKNSRLSVQPVKPEEYRLILSIV